MEIPEEIKQVVTDVACRLKRYYPHVDYEDLRQEGLHSVLKVLGRMRGYVYLEKDRDVWWKIVWNGVRRELRLQTQQDRFEGNAINMESMEFLSGKDQKLRWKELVNSFPPSTRDYIILRDRGHNDSEIGRILGKSLYQIKTIRKEVLSCLKRDFRFTNFRAGSTGGYS